jgi:SurA N-terminal domain
LLPPRLGVSAVKSAFVSASLCLCVLLFSLSAETIDRIVVSVGSRVITASELDRQVHLAAFLSGTRPDFSPAARRAMADRMVENKLMQAEVETTHYIAPDASAIDPALADFRKRYFHSDDEYRRALAAAGLSEQDVRDELLRQRVLNGFIEIRFHPAVQVSEQEIQDYYRKNLAGKGVELAQVHAQVEQILMEQGADRAVDAWLREARRRTEIVYHDEAFQ